MSARPVALVVASAALALLGAAAPAAAAPSAGMDETGTGTAADACGGVSCPHLAAAGAATGRPFAAASFDLSVRNLTGARPGPGQCAKVGVVLRLHQGGDSFIGEGQGKVCAAADGTATVSSKYSGGGVVGTDVWMWGGGQGTLIATFAVDGSVRLRATGSYSISPMR